MEGVCCLSSNINDHPLVGQQRVGEDRTRLVQQRLFHLGRQELGRIVTQDKLTDVRHLGNLCRLEGCAVTTLTRFYNIRVRVSGFVIEQIGTLDKGDNALGIERVAAIGILFAGTTRGGQQFVGNHLTALRVGPVQPQGDAFIIGDRNLQLPTTVHQQMARTRFLLEQEAAARHPMVQRDSPDGQCRFVVDDLTPSGIERRKPHLHAQLGAEVLEERAENTFRVGGAMNDHFARALAQPQGRDESHQPEAMVAMQVAEQDMTYLAKRHLAAAQTHLHTLATIDQKLVSSEIDHLRRRGMPQRRFGTTTAQYGHFKTIQNCTKGTILLPRNIEISHIGK